MSRDLRGPARGSATRAGRSADQQHVAGYPGDPNPGIGDSRSSSIARRAIGNAGAAPGALFCGSATCCAAASRFGAAVIRCAPIVGKPIRMAPVTGGPKKERRPGQGRRVQVGRNAFRPRRIVCAVLTALGERTVNQKQKSWGRGTSTDAGNTRRGAVAVPGARATRPHLPFVRQQGMSGAHGLDISHPRAPTRAAGHTSISVRALERFPVEVVSCDTTLC